MKIRILIVFVAALYIMGCAAGHLTVDEAYDILRPVKPLELPEQTTENFIIKIGNVADEGSSYKNRIDLYVNGKRVDPNWLVSNVQDEFVYRMKVRPGYYDIKAYYFAYIGWGDEKYKIISSELIPVSHDKVTTVKCDIAKKPNGEPVNKVMYFKSEREEID
ncbi:hypothetical protein JW935_09985 [candidate division KSB1 bacterium]|nr:hypothetical protein [candidate division KSB1 bacterium]